MWVVYILVTFGLFFGVPAFFSSIGEKVGEARKEVILHSSKLEQERSLTNNAKKMLESLLRETRQGNPELALQIADIEYERDIEIARKLKDKKRPAKKAADEVKAI